MNILDAIFTRRSIRKFTGQPVTEEQLHTILRAGFSAPSCMNKRPWHFVVLRDAATLKAVTKVHPYSEMLPEAGCGIVICADKNLNGSEFYLNQDSSAAVENMLLAAHGLGLGGVWLGMHSEDRIQPLKALLNLPEQVIPFAIIAVGTPNEKRAAPDRYEADKVHFDKW